MSNDTNVFTKKPHGPPHKTRTILHSLLVSAGQPLIPTMAPMHHMKRYVVELSSLHKPSRRE
ncbi:MAG: hypothetical protein A4E19_11540 [Nitrospira sp. SG-bin1]|nr:MAG: hypothetical protein A4E19_11540 [Nitrospira sp. SG-bin1]